MNKNLIYITDTYYNSWENLMQLIHQKMDFYFQIPFMIRTFSDLRPKYILDVTHPAYFCDVIAVDCLDTFDPQEPMDWALERCIADALHKYTHEMDHADPGKVKMHSASWEQYPVDSLLRLAWRNCDKKLRIPFYLKKESPTELADRFVLIVKDGCVTLEEYAHRQRYVEDLNGIDYDTFCESMYRFFQCATKDYGYCEPKFVWLSKRKMKMEVYP